MGARHVRLLSLVCSVVLIALQQGEPDMHKSPGACTIRNSSGSSYSLSYVMFVKQAAATDVLSDDGPAMQLLRVNIGNPSVCFVLLRPAGLIHVHAHSHTGCGHSLVAEEAKRWSQLHRGHRQLLEQQAEAGVLGAEEEQPPMAAGSSSGVATNSSSGQYGRPVPRMLAASGTVPIRVWVEYQGVDSLSADGKQRLYDTVNIALGVLQKFYKVRG